MKSAPDSPDGFSEPEPYGEDSVYKRVSSAAVGLTAFGLLVIFYPVQEIASSAIADSIGEATPLIDSLFVVLTIPSGLMLTVFVHENIHYAASRLMGYDPEISYLPPRVTNDYQFMRRRDSMISLISPFILVNLAAGLIIWLESGSLVSLTAMVCFVVNTSSSGSDIFGFFSLLRRPKGTVVKTVVQEGARESFVFEPK
ncbi:DUF3267 domain-containing protein [Haloarchaeobius amylolyticus]|uniref:DUF3267 domain-containing protein n=1 Tax=Haloarchaeobius amylolyticus TaxID=1198296 RepID=UPI00226D81AB|nr:DUF3267 domain-containing protein [Haloarchaeobius amylolyticus]